MYYGGSSPLPNGIILDTPTSRVFGHLEMSEVTVRYVSVPLLRQDIHERTVRGVTERKQERV